MLDNFKRFTSSHPKKTAVLVGVTLALLIFMSTLQLTINGSDNTYTIDVGEIQNALPRWGTLHFPGYPLYSLTGSIFVTFLQLFGIEPAIGASLLSALWAGAAIALLITLDMTYDVPGPVAIITALLFAVSTSFWVDASLAEVHTLTVALMLASLLFAVRFSRNGERSDLYWLAFFSSQMVYHQRAMIFLGPGLLILALRQRRALLKSSPVALLIAVAGAAIYLYLPFRDWLGANWTFNQPGTWQGFWGLVLDTKTERIISFPESAASWLDRGSIIVSVLSGEWPLLLLAAGLLGIIIGGIKEHKLEALALSVMWLPYVFLSVLIWVGRVADALLAVNLPVLVMAALGLALLTTAIIRLRRPVGIVLTIGWLLLTIYLFWDHRPTVLEITKDLSAEEIINKAENIEPAKDGRPTTLMAPWGKDFWALIYAQEYQDQLSDLTIVDHNGDLGSIMNSEEHLVTLSDTFFLWPLSWWDDKYGRVYLSSNSAFAIEVDTSPPVDANQVPKNQDFDLQNGIVIRNAVIEWLTPELLSLTIYWEAIDKPLEDYSVAVHLVRQDPPLSQEDILAQADRSNPVAGWYPTSRWESGEVIKDEYLIQVPAGASAESVRIGMYQTADDGGFINSEWLSLTIDD